MENQKQPNEHQRQRCEVWIRVMGYHRPVSAFNKGKQSTPLNSNAGRICSLPIVEGVV
ncbi:MAG: hypothetical protein ACTHYN_13690 [Marinobacter sp.]|uniref:hypothetical protein n=1 Tax=Gammaproteobacteria TaxID=1236 RepID=UPI003F95B4FA